MFGMNKALLSLILCLFINKAAAANNATSILPLQFIIYLDTSLTFNHFDTAHYEIRRDSIMADRKIHIYLMFLKAGDLDTVYFKNGIHSQNPYFYEKGVEISYEIRSGFLTNAINNIGDFCFMDTTMQVKYDDSQYLHFYRFSLLAGHVLKSCKKKNIFRVLLFRPARYYSNRCMMQKQKEIIEKIEREKSIDILHQLWSTL